MLVVESKQDTGKFTFTVELEKEFEILGEKVTVGFLVAFLLAVVTICSIVTLCLAISFLYCCVRKIMKSRA